MLLMILFIKLIEEDGTFSLKLYLSDQATMVVLFSFTVKVFQQAYIPCLQPIIITSAIILVFKRKILVGLILVT